MYKYILPYTEDNVLNNIKYYNEGSVVICEEAYKKLIAEGHYEGYDEILIQVNSKNIFRATIQEKDIIDDNLLSGNFVKLYSVIL